LDIYGVIFLETNRRVVQSDKRLLVETIVVLAITIILFIAFNSLRSVIAALPALYLIIERRIKHLSWSDIGFKFKNTFSDVKKNWIWVGVVGIISPLLTFYIGKLFLPGFIEHVGSRLPLDVKVIIPALITITIGTFLEEVIFRGYIQERLGIFIGIPSAIIATSILFGFMHYSSGPLNIVAFDIAGIFIDSILYGIIYAKTKNIFAPWIGHYLSDIVGIICLLFLL
jgi:membrane protease YdiL (CAAX protease family)